MSVININTKATGTYVSAQAWVSTASGRVDFKDGKAELSAGRYELKWLFIGDPGASVTYVVDAAEASSGKAPCTAGAYTVPNGKNRLSSGKYKPVGYKAVEFDVR